MGYRMPQTPDLLLTCCRFELTSWPYGLEHTHMLCYFYAFTFGCLCCHELAGAMKVLSYTHDLAL